MLNLPVRGGNSVSLSHQSSCCNPLTGIIRQAYYRNMTKGLNFGNDKPGANLPPQKGKPVRGARKCLSVSEFYLYSPVALISLRRFFGIHRMKLGESRGREALLGNALLGQIAHD